MKRAAINYENIVNDMKQYFVDDKKRIEHALQVLSFTDIILKGEQITSDVAIFTAVLHDIGIKECEKKYKSTAGYLQEIEGPPIARKILQKNGIDEETIKETCDIIANHHTKDGINSKNFDILWDADQLVNLKAEYLPEESSKIKKIIEKVFRTETAKNIAKEIYLLEEE